MSITQMARITSLILCLSCFVLPAFADAAHLCDVDELLRESSSDLAAYERVKKTLFGRTTEGVGVEYYYSPRALKVIKAAYYGETGKTGIQYYFSAPTTYVVRSTKYYYSHPISAILRGDHFQLASTTTSEFVVCRGDLVRGLWDELVEKDFKWASEALEDLLAEAPKRKVLEEGSR